MTTAQLDPVNALLRLYGWKTSYLARKLGMNRQTLSTRLDGTHPWRSVELPALSSALDVPMEVLTDMSGEEAIVFVLGMHTDWHEKRCLLHVVGPDPQPIAA